MTATNIVEGFDMRTRNCVCICMLSC